MSAYMTAMREASRKTMLDQIERLMDERDSARAALRVYACRCATQCWYPKDSYPCGMTAHLALSSTVPPSDGDPHGQSALAQKDGDGAPAPAADIWRHKARGTTYTIVGAAELQCAAPIPEKTQLTIYLDCKDGALWARPTTEFFDGRFVLAVPSQEAPANG